MDDHEVLRELQSRIHRLCEENEKLKGQMSRVEVQIAANLLCINTYANLISECETNGLPPVTVVGG